MSSSQDKLEPEKSVRIDSQNAIVPGNFKPMVKELDRIAPRWVCDRLTESEIVVALPGIDRLPWDAAFGFTPSNLDAEKQFSSFCSQTGSLGISATGWVLVDFLVEDSQRLNATFLRQAQKFGWTDQQLLEIVPALDLAIELRHRRRGAAGWLLCHPPFLEQRDVIMEKWNQLPSSSRPSFPLQQSTSHTIGLSGTYPADAVHVVEFKSEFKQFCDSWRLLGMYSWEMPQPDGPKWTDLYLGRPTKLPEGTTCRDTPFHLPIVERDGLGAITMKSHCSLAESRGFLDQSKWQSYASIALISFWEWVIDHRYGDRTRARGYQTRKAELISDVLMISEDRIKKLKLAASRLKSGKDSTLRI